MSKLQEFVERKLAEYRAAKDTLVDDTSSVDFFMKNWKIRNIEGQFRRILQSVDLLIDEKLENVVMHYAKNIRKMLTFMKH